MLGAGPHARGKEEARVIKHGPFAFAHCLEASGEVGELAAIVARDPLVGRRLVVVRGRVVGRARVEERIKEPREIAAQ